MSRYTGLGDIEDGQVVGLSAPAGLAPIGLSRPPTAHPVPAPAPAPDPGPEPALVGESTVGERGQKRPAKPAPRRRHPKPAAVEKPPQTRPTTTNVPVSTANLIDQCRKEQQLSAGEVIVIAIEAEYDNLANLLQGPRRTGMFETHASRLPRRDDEPLKTISYRLTDTDIATIDTLVEQFGARSRSHLISVAVNAHYR
ncbi:MAG: hypothetical protein LCH96_14660 [Actinobacteria bacterium]|nr:hypothetical protein [Actinomycetota bacterium]